MPVKTIIQKRRDTAANWTSTNPILAAGEEGYETDTRKSKVGDGSTAWTSLAYSGLGGDVTVAGTQTLTNKTLTAPVINSAALSLATIETVWTYVAGFAGATISLGSQGAVHFNGVASTSDGSVNINWTSGVTLNTKLGVGQSVTCTLAITNSTTAYKVSGVQIDGTATGVSTEWAGGSAPSAGNPNSIDTYTFTVIKTANATFTVLASFTRFA